MCHRYCSPVVRAVPGWWWLYRCSAAVSGFADTTKKVMGSPRLVYLFIEVGIIRSCIKNV